ncbi:DUF5819 family protein [Promicromonospora sukumoe]|uniref:DUF5819 family protein n=1 Tax=Promicromonospora sukumoe TaxID=88382 RepID=UPI0003A1C0D3|nr:DUF5819 family protein [Promicromonospora sukumoe]
MSTTPGAPPARSRPTTTPGQPAVPSVPARVRGLVVVVWVVLLAHLVATFVWAAPGYLTGRPAGESIGDAPTTAVHRALEPYMTPVFAQNWSVFAPSPLHVEYSLRVRGVYAGGPDGDLAPGPWIDATAVEVRALTGHVLPAATERPSRRLATDLRSAFLELPEDGRAALLVSPVAAGSGADGGSGGSDAAPWAGLRAALLDAGGAPDAVDDYLGRDRAVAAYATQVLRASGDDAVPGGAGSAGAGSAASSAPAAPVLVQASVLRQEVAPRGSGARPAPSELVLGARPPVVVPGQDDAAFRRTWAALRGDGVVGQDEPGVVGPAEPEPAP